MATNNQIPTDAKGSGIAKEAVLFFVVAAIMLIAYAQFGDLHSLENLAMQETRIRACQADRSIIVYVAAFLSYVVVPGLSFPDVAVVTLVDGWHFRLFRGHLLVSFTSTAS